MKTLWGTLADLQGDHGQRFRLRGEDVLHLCLFCDTSYPQTDEGWLALKQHGFDEHEQIIYYDWRELHGKQVTIGVVERNEMVGFGKHERASGETQTELIARTEDGTIYFLPFSYYDSDYKGGFKCKPKSPESNLLKLMQPDLV